MQKLTERLRPAALERADLVATAKLLGTDALTHEQQARIILLGDIVDSLTEEICQLDPEDCGEVC